ncbi:CLUMA_CG019596, isoform A [Clunio marinus]|uniref:CLUMA_CG019596, isoform A n=1 Tax=Clunio marinus TaxID=568069 RepID=A0A1J1J438_9DIPT|nr:CLUMA_CG019596, isoform A [Clunio marinus]
MKIIFVLVVFVAAVVASTSALRCYDCSFPRDSKCEELKDAQELTKECPEPSTFEKGLGIKSACLKTIENGSCTKDSKLVLNACASPKESFEHCSICYSDLCNN